MQGVWGHVMCAWPDIGFARSAAGLGRHGVGALQLVWAHALAVGGGVGAEPGGKLNIQPNATKQSL
jgi:hypothetical protein